MNNNFSKIIKRKLGIILLSGILLGSLSFLFVIVSQKNFKSETELLISINQGENQDFYLLSRSAEQIGKTIKESIYSETFIDSLMQTNKINATFLPSDKKSKLESWKSMVKVDTNAGSGIIKIKVVGNDRNEVKNISEGMVEVLTGQNNFWGGNAENIKIAAISGPILESNPGIITIFMAAVTGFVLGVLLNLLWILYKNSRYINFDPTKNGNIDTKSEDIFKIVKRRWKFFISVIIVFVAFSVLLSIFQVSKFQSSSRIIVSQKLSSLNDPYALVKSNEAMGKILSEVITSQSFFQEITASGNSINRTSFGMTLQDQLKNWKKNIEIRTINDTGILEISIYNQNKRQSEIIADTINRKLSENPNNIYGFNSSVQFRIIEGPVTSMYPVKPNMLIYFSVAFVSGIIFSLVCVYLFPRKGKNENVGFAFNNIVK